MRENDNRGVAQLASASGLGPEGPVFESQYPDLQGKQLSEFQVVAFSFFYILSFCYIYAVNKKQDIIDKNGW